VNLFVSIVTKILNPLLKRIPHLIYYNNGNLLIQASCRRNFILEVVLTNAFGEPVKDREVLFKKKGNNRMLLYLF
jgi:hypothetical protein